MKPRRSPLVWAAAIPTLAVVLWLLWGLRGEPSPERGSAPLAAQVERAETAPEPLLPSKVIAPAAQASLAERTLAAVETPPTDTLQGTRPWVEGMVVHVGGKGPIAGIELDVFARVEPPVLGIEAESTYFVTRVRSGDDGRFVLLRSAIPPRWHAGAAPQLVFLQADVPGFARFQTPFPPLPAEPAQVLVQLHPNAVLIGRILGANGMPIPHVEVALETLGRESGEPQEGNVPRKTAATPQGAVLAKQLGELSGRFRLDLRDDEWKSVQKAAEDVLLRVSHREFGMARVELPAGKLAELPAAHGLRDVDLGDLVVVFSVGKGLHGPPTLTGQLVDPEGHTIRGHTLRIVGEGPAPSARARTRIVVTDVEGRFGTDGLYGRSVATHSSEEDVRAALRQGDGIELPVEAGEPLRLVWPLHRVRVRVVDRDGAPARGASVHLVQLDENGRPAAEARRGSTDVDGVARDLFAPPGSTANLLATHGDGRIVRARVEIPRSPHLTLLDLVFERAPPGEVRLALDPPLHIDPFGLGLMSYGGPEVVVLRIQDETTGAYVPVTIETRELGRATATLAPGWYLLRVAYVPEGYAPPREPLPFEVVAGGVLNLTVAIERAALLRVVPLDRPARAALRNPVDVGAPNRVWGDVVRAPSTLPDDPAPILAWNPRGVVAKGAPQMRAVHVPAGRYGLRWRWEGGEEWLGEIAVRSGETSRVELAGPVPTREDVGPRWLVHEPR
ncbi:MAG: hypothetical protein GC161_10915 [Planctomycetaceae bacterium]|nr:hypothetical protein [Planctomycetaceae bacterium]